MRSAGVLPDERCQRIWSGLARLWLTAAQHPLANHRTPELASAFCARQLGCGPEERAPDLLMIGKLGICGARDGVEVDAWIDDEDGVHPLVTSFRIA